MNQNEIANIVITSEDVTNRNRLFELYSNFRIGLGRYKSHRNPSGSVQSYIVIG